MSILDFQETIIPLLDLTSNVSKWDGRTIRDKEQKIREASLILAGQCIALLLYNLSQLKSALLRPLSKLLDGGVPKVGDMENVGDKC